MVCIYCGGNTQVINSRHQKRLNRVWRRRRCLTCHSVISTHEAVSYEDSWRVGTAAGLLQPFLRDKLFISIQKSCEHRPHSIADAAALTATTISRLQPLQHDGYLANAIIIETVKDVLEYYDVAAYTHYVAFHLNGQLI